MGEVLSVEDLLYKAVQTKEPPSKLRAFLDVSLFLNIDIIYIN